MRMHLLLRWLCQLHLPKGDGMLNHLGRQWPFLIKQWQWRSLQSQVQRQNWEDRGWSLLQMNPRLLKKKSSSPSVFLPTSPAYMTTSDVICAPQSTRQSEKAPSQCEKSTSFTAFSSKSENLPSFVSTPLSAASDTKVEITVSSNKVAAEVDGPDKTKSTPMFGNAFFKSGDSSSADPFSTGSQTNNTTLLNGVLSTVPPKIDASCPVTLTNTSTYKISVPASLSPSSSVTGLTSNVEAQSTVASSICAPVTCSTSLLPGSVTFSVGSGFPLSSSTSATSASINTNNSCNKSNATVCLFDAKPSALISGRSTFSEKNTGVDVQFSRFGASNKLPFSFQTASTPSFVRGSTCSVLPSASTSATSLAGTIGLSSGSIFGSYPLALGPTTVSSSLGSSFTSSSVSTSSSTAPSSIFSFTSHSKPTTTIAPDSPSPTFSFDIGSSGAASSSSFIFGAMPTTNSPRPTSTRFSASSSPTISFGLGSSGATTGSSSLIFGATPTTNSLTVSNSVPFVFGGNSASTHALCNSPFADNDPMTMDTMAEDSLQPVPPPFVAPLLAPIGGFGSN